jgi:hypothetical protein
MRAPLSQYHRPRLKLQLPHPTARNIQKFPNLQTFVLNNVTKEGVDSDKLRAFVSTEVDMDDTALHTIAANL